MQELDDDRTIGGMVTDDRARYGLVGMCSLGLVAWILAGPRTSDVLVIGTLVLSALLMVLVVWSARAKRSTAIATIIGSSVVLVGGTAAMLLDAPGARIAILVSILGAAVVSPVVLVVALARRRRVDVQMLLGALSIYLLMGLSFAFAYALIGATQSTPMFITADGLRDGAFDEQLYFSFITLSTTGYGDFAPNSGSMRALAIFEAIGGQLYLLTAVAAIVGLLTSRFGAAAEPPTRPPAA